MYDKFLEAYAIAKESQRVDNGLVLPSLMYIKDLADERGEVDWKGLLPEATGYKKNTYDPKVARMRQIQLNLNDLHYGLYNATVDTEKVIDMDRLMAKVIEKGLVQKTVQGLTFKVIKIESKYGGFKHKAFEYTREYGPKTFETNKTISVVEFSIKVSGSLIQGASFSIFNTGRVRFSAGYIEGNPDEPRRLFKFISDTYMPLGTNEINVNNHTTEFQIGYPIHIKTIYTVFDERYKAEYNRERVTATMPMEMNTTGKKTPYVYVKFPQFSLICSKTGSIQIQGASDPRSATELTKKFVETMKNIGLLEMTTSSPKKRTEPKPTKMARRANMLPAPNVTRRGTTCPTGRCPVPYSFDGVCPGGNELFYVKPNPQGQPCCYKKPKSLKYSRAKVEAVYAKANVRVPNNVRNLFEFGNNTVGKNTNVGKAVPDIVTYYNKTIGKNGKEVGFKIDTRQCTRYTKVALVDIAKRFGIASVPSTATKGVLCKMIQDASEKLHKDKTDDPKVTVGRKAVVVFGNKLKIGKRVCDTYPKDVLFRYARELGLDVDSSMTKVQVCSLIGKATNMLRESRAVPTAVVAPRVLRPMNNLGTSNNSIMNAIKQHKNLTVRDDEALRNLRANIKDYLKVTKRLKTKVTKANIDKIKKNYLTSKTRVTVTLANLGF
jgi:hypothetical protein